MPVRTLGCRLNKIQQSGAEALETGVIAHAVFILPGWFSATARKEYVSLGSRGCKRRKPLPRLESVAETCTLLCEKLFSYGCCRYCFLAGAFTVCGGRAVLRRERCPAGDPMVPFCCPTNGRCGRSDVRSSWRIFPST